MKIFMAVKENFKEGKQNIGWLLQEKMLLGLQRSSNKKLVIVITHVHVPSQNVRVENRQREKERTEKRLQRYAKLCSKHKVDAEILVHVAENVAKGLVELIELHKITKFVMGAASDRRYTKNMITPKSQTACSVSLFAEKSCDIWFVCRGNIVSRREKLSYISPKAERELLQSISQLASSNAKLLTLDVSLISTLLGSPSYAEQQTEEDMVCTTKIQKLQSFSEFSRLEIEQATQNFDQTLKIGEGGFGNVYRGQIRNTTVAIKKLNLNGLQGKIEFQQEVAILGKVRHPNIVTLIGACSEECAIIYEFLPNGSLADRLKRKNNTRPLTYRTRTRIALEICSALSFLHSNKPHSIVHGDLKPQNILLDSNLISKLGDFGICRLLQQSTSSGTTFYHQTEKLKGTIPYMDPDYLSTNKLTRFSDVHSFGVVILQLVTGLRAAGIVDAVRRAVEKEELNAIVDESAGPWPFVQVKKLALLGLRCCDVVSRNRPDLEEEVWPLLRSMVPDSLEGDVDGGDVPDYFICPITMNVMKDPHIGADGFTYEGKAIKDWFAGGNSTSPVTNAPLDNMELIQNLSLRYVVEAWFQKHKGI